MRSLSLLTTLLALFCSCTGHTLHWGRTCPDVQAMPNLSVDKILGQWYVAYKVDTSNTCLVWNLTKSETNSEQLHLTEYRQFPILDSLRIDHKNSLSAEINIPNPEIPSRMRIRWPTSMTGSADFVVFDTDYDKYLAIFECDRAGIFHRRSAAILARELPLDDMFISRVRRLMNNAEVSHEHLKPINQGKCRESSQREWHIDERLFGLLPESRKAELREALSRGIRDYDLSEIEILSEGVSPLDDTFRGSVKDGRKAEKLIQ